MRKGSKYLTPLPDIPGKSTLSDSMTLVPTAQHSHEPGQELTPIPRQFRVCALPATASGSSGVVILLIVRVLPSTVRERQVVHTARSCIRSALVFPLVRMSQSPRHHTQPEPTCLTSRWHISPAQTVTRASHRLILSARPPDDCPPQTWYQQERPVRPQALLIWHRHSTSSGGNYRATAVQPLSSARSDSDAVSATWQSGLALFASSSPGGR
jgi:hypothetical protein